MAKEKAIEPEKKWPFGPTNYYLIGAALFFVIVGYVALASGSITWAPILLVLGYCVFFPAGIIWGGCKKEDTMCLSADKQESSGTQAGL